MGSIYRPQRSFPFLHRNWIAGVNSWQAMGVKLSTPNGMLPDRFNDLEDDHYSRPAKRRRFAEPSPDSSSFPQDCGSYCFPEQPGDQQRALRIEILKIIHKDSSRVKFNGISAPSLKDVVDSRSRCRITIYCEKAGAPLLLHCDSQICEVKSFKNPVGPSRMARIHLPLPFTIPEHKILIERHDEEAFDIADAYNVVLELESAGDTNWPPVNLVGSHGENGDFFAQRPSSTRHWVLSANIPDLFGRPRTRIPLRLRKGSEHNVSTDFVAEVDVRWTTGFSEKLMTKRLEKDVLPSIIAIDPDERYPAVVNGYVNDEVNGHYTNGYATNGLVNGTNGVLDYEDDEGEGERTPNRSLRARENKKNYNLKDLSAKAQGKERRRSRKLDRWDKPSDNFTVTYNLPAEQLTVDGFVCCICMAATQSMAQLRAHFFSHPQYNVLLETRPNRSGNSIGISHADTAPGSPLRPRVYQLGRATKPLDLEKYVEGDDSWVTSRYGPDNDVVVRQPPARVIQKLGPRRKDTKLVVPNTKQPLFDPLSKVLLEAGSEIRRQVANDSWLLHKHREVVQDYSDVDSAEKEYIKEWDAFIMRRHISSDAYVPRTVIAFAKEKGPWLVAATSRMEEFGKHLSVMIARGALDDRTIEETLARIGESRNQHKEGDEVVPKTTLSPKEAAYRSIDGCAVCGLPVLGPSLLICSNQDCTRRLYHDDCVSATAKVPVDSLKWFCNDCASAENGRAEDQIP